MRKSEVYSWRLTRDLKSLLEQAARSESTSVADLLERIVQDWLERHEPGGDEEAQRRLQRAAAATFGAVRGGDPSRATRARDLVRSRVRRRHAR